jgi:hypothetical protein
MTTTERTDQKLTELGIDERAELPSKSFALTLYLRKHRIDARLSPKSRGRVVTVPSAHEPTSLALMKVWQEDGSDPVRDGRSCLRKWGRKVTADA